MGTGTCSAARERASSESMVLDRESMCSLEEAFQTFTEPEPRNADLDRKERKKKRRAVLPPPEPAVIEPDRPAHRALPPAELLGGGPTEYRKSTSVSEMLNAYENAYDGDSYFPHPSQDSTNSNMYRLEPDWATAFNDSSTPDWIKSRMPSREAETPLVPSPWLDGAATLWQKIPDSQATQANLTGAAVAANTRVDELQRKLDSMFKKLDDIEVARSESTHIEIILFVLGGIFVLLMLDLLVKQGTQATLMFAAAGGSLGSIGGGRFVNSFKL
jgi:hypothetical protein